MTENYSELETAADPSALKRVAIEPVTRVEGHGKVTLLLDDDNRVQQARMHIVEFRGFEKFVQGRPYWELPVLVQRLCGICPVSHHLAAAKAIDRIAGVREIPIAADLTRRLAHFGQVLQSHALHFFHLSSPDLLFGYNDEVTHRNFVGVLEDYPDIALQGIGLRKYGQQIIEAVAGKRIHGNLAVPGGVNRLLDADGRRHLIEGVREIRQWSRDAVTLARRLHRQNHEHSRNFATINTGMLSLSSSDGALELYDGPLRARQRNGSPLFDGVDCDDYGRVIREEVKAWSYMKFPYLTELGTEEGIYRVGPLARVNNCDYIDTEEAEAERQVFLAENPDGMVQSTLAFHWARMIELHHCVEAIERLLADDRLSEGERQSTGDMTAEGIGVIEAPRGTLIHHYEVGEDSLVRRANLIVSTTNNNRAMNASIRRVAKEQFDGRQLSEALLNQIEVAIRAYDPCLSCATHALGKMPLILELKDKEDNLLDTLVRNGDGTLSAPPAQ